jgi:ferredoxin-NADP reductase
LAPAVLIGGFLIARKIRREDMVYVFILTVIVISGVITIANAGNVFTLVSRLFLHSSLLFFAGMMLTEPLTMPPTTNLQIIYAMITGILFTPQIHFGNFYTTPELALVLGNVYSYLVSPKEKLWLTLKEKISVSPDVVDFIFYSNKRFSYLPGQYMEWTLAHDHPDSRGNRRYLTLASSPTENDIRVGVKFYDNGSSYKKALQILDRTTPIVASQRGGSFTLPSDTRGKLVFIAGGIGVTPFRSMIRYLVDTRQARSIVLLYSNRRANDILYRDVFDRAQQSLGIRTVYTLTDASAVPHDWQGRRGRIDGNMIREEIPDYRERTFYLSGSQPLVQSLEETLHGLGVANGHIVKDYFPGLV